MCSPNEDMAHVIERHFERISLLNFQMKAIWPGNPLWVWPEQPQNVFIGDSAHFFACYKKPVEGTVILTSDTHDIRKEKEIPPFQEETASKPESIAALGLSRHLQHLDDETCGILAEQYGLLTQWTKYILVLERDANKKLSSLPDIRQVPQMQAAGWGGSSFSFSPSLFGFALVPFIGDFSARYPASAPFSKYGQIFSAKSRSFFEKSSFNQACLEDSPVNYSPVDDSPVDDSLTDDLLLSLMNDLVNLDTITLNNVLNLQSLPTKIETMIQRFTAKYADENFVLGAFLTALCDVLKDNEKLTPIQDTAQDLLDTSTYADEEKKFLIKRFFSTLNSNS